MILLQNSGADGSKDHTSALEAKIAELREELANKVKGHTSVYIESSL